MSSDLQTWQRSAIRNTTANYRRTQENYYIAGKPLVEVESGYRAFSLLTPPLGSPAARRRVRLIMENLLKANGDVSPCDFTPYSFGNIREQSLKDIWESMSGHPLYKDPSARRRLSKPDSRVKLSELAPV